MMKKILSLILTLVLIMTMSVTAFAENVSITKETDQKEIAGIANSFFMEKEDAFLSDGNLKIAEYYSTNDVKNIKNDSSFHLFEYEKQMRDDNYLNICYKIKHYKKILFKLCYKEQDLCVFILLGNYSVSPSAYDKPGLVLSGCIV